jgi:hypothetical protein
VLGAHVQRAFRAEGLQQHGRRAGGRHLQQAGAEAVEVEQRDHQQHAVVRGDGCGLELRALVHVGQQRAVGQHHAARHAGGARGVADDGDVLAAARGGAGVGGGVEVRCLEVVAHDEPGAAVAQQAWQFR